MKEMNDDNCELQIVGCHSREESKRSRRITWCRLLLTLRVHASRSTHLLAMQEDARVIAQGVDRVKLD